MSLSKAPLAHASARAARPGSEIWLPWRYSCLSAGTAPLANAEQSLLHSGRHLALEGKLLLAPQALLLLLLILLLRPRLLLRRRRSLYSNIEIPNVGTIFG